MAYNKTALLCAGAWRYENFWTKCFQEDEYGGTDQFHGILVPPDVTSYALFSSEVRQTEESYILQLLI
jgi:hypothetical protein